jgi:hypothetical protein
MVIGQSSIFYMFGILITHYLIFTTCFHTGENLPIHKLAFVTPILNYLLLHWMDSIRETLLLVTVFSDM